MPIPTFDFFFRLPSLTKRELGPSLTSDPGIGVSIVAIRFRLVNQSLRSDSLEHLNTSFVLSDLKGKKKTVKIKLDKVEL